MEAKVISDEPIYKGRVFTLVKRAFEHEGQTYKYDVITHPGAVVIIPQDADGKLLVERQFRAAVGKYILEFPAGTLEVGEDPKECAIRELAEEVKASAKEWTSLGQILPSPGMSSEVQHCFLARGLGSASGELDEGEIIEVKKFTVQQLEEAILDGSFADAKSIAAFARAKLMKLL